MKNFFILAGVCSLGLANIASAQSIFYFYDAGVAGTFPVATNGGAVASANPVLTRLVADDVNYSPDFAGLPVTRVEFGTYNGNAAATTCRPRLRFWQQNAPTQDPLTSVFGPGVTVASPTNWALTFNPLAAPAGLQLFAGDTTAFAWTAPASGKIWIGMTFDNSDGAAAPAVPAPIPGTTEVELNNLGYAVANPAVGSSANVMFQTTNPGSFFGVTNPPGAMFQFTGATPPVANMWGFALGTPGQDLTGSITLNDVGATFAYNRTITLTAFAGTKTVTTTAVVATGATTTFTLVLPATMPAALSGPVTVVADGSSFLKKTTAVTLTGGTQDLGIISLQNGDVDNSGEVDAADIDQVIAAFGSTFTTETPASVADVDVSGEVDAADIDIVIANFGGTDN